MILFKNGSLITTIAKTKLSMWEKVIISYPIQTDSCNCGVFTSLFIENLIKHGFIHFDTTDMQIHRAFMANTIKSVAISI